MMAAVAGILALWLGVTLHLGAHAATGRILGAPLTEIQIGTFPLLSFRIRSVAIRIGVLPGGFVRFQDPKDRRPPSGLTYAPEAAFSDLPAWRQLAISLAGPAAMFAAAMVLLGPLVAARSVANTWPELFRGAIPYFGRDAWADVVALRATSAGAIAGVVLAKLTAFNLAPLPSAPGGQVMEMLLVRTSPLHDFWLRASLIAGVIPLFWLLNAVLWFLIP